jgi:hypothetical protein
MKKLGLILIIIGLVMTVITGFNIITKKKVVDIGKIEINKEEKTPVYWSPILGILLLGTGVVISVTNKEKV